jgi:hypothetical protein
VRLRDLTRYPLIIPSRPHAIRTLVEARRADFPAGPAGLYVMPTWWRHPPRYNSPMDALADIVTCLAAISDSELGALATTIDAAVGFAPGLTAWLEHAVGWEHDRRTGRNYPLQGPRAAIDDAEVDASLATLVILGATFRQDRQPEDQQIAHFFDTAARVLHAEVEAESSRLQ